MMARPRLQCLGAAGVVSVAGLGVVRRASRSPDQIATTAAENDARLAKLEAEMKAGDAVYLRCFP